MYISEGEKDRVLTFITLQSIRQNLVIIAQSVYMCLRERCLMNCRISDRYQVRSRLSVQYEQRQKAPKAQYSIPIPRPCNLLSSVTKTGYLKHISNHMATQLK